MSIFRNAITESDGVSVNVGYLCLFLVMALVLLVIPIMVIFAVVQAIYDKTHTFPFSELGKGAGMVTAAFSTALGALGLFVWGDRSGPAQQTTITATTGPTVTTTVGPTAPQEASQYHG